MSELIAKKQIAVARLVLRERRPPPPKFSTCVRPHHMRYEVGRYRERLRSGPGGLGRARIWKPEQVGEQHNIILDAFYTQILPTTAWQTWIRYGAVGTGSAAPSTTDTQLAAEVARTNNPTPDYATNNQVQVSRVADGVYKYSWGVEFSPILVGGKNLSEWGFTPQNTSTVFVTRELFRDGSGNPIVISLATDQYLRLYYAVQIQLQPLSQPVTLNITNLGTINATLLLYSGNTSTSGTARADLNVFETFARGGSLYVVARDGQAPTGYYSTTNFNNTASVSIANATLDATQRKRVSPQAIFDPTTANFSWTRISLYYNGEGAVLSLSTPITKDSLHKLILDPWTISW